jgi:predicted dehydrogenase
VSLWLIGAGPHAREYAKVLKNQEIDFEVIGRSASSAKEFEFVTGKSVRAGGLTQELQKCGAPDQAIVAVSFEQLANVAIELMKAGTRRILLEKPGGLSNKEILLLGQTAMQYKAEVWIGYNRRFYSATTYAREEIVKDGGAVSCIFEFTEWAHTVVPLDLGIGVKEAWMIANSSHVADLAFHLCGVPKEWKSWHSGKMDWHPTATRFCGSGITDLGALFSYHADWDAPGRWGLEVLTRKRRFIFRPMEQMHVTHLASTKVEQIPLDDSLDKDFKPGLFRQTKAFIEGDYDLFCTLEEQIKMISIYSEMAGYR